MSKKAKNALIVVASLAATALGIYMAIPPKSGFRRGIEHRRPYVCEACGCRFMELPAEGTLKCPNCGGEAVRAKFFVCGRCGAEFEAYRFKAHYVPVTPADGGEPVVGAFYKKPDGDWVRSPNALGEIKCPKCGNADKATMSEKPYSGEDAKAPVTQ